MVVGSHAHDLLLLLLLPPAAANDDAPLLLLPSPYCPAAAASLSLCWREESKAIHTPTLEIFGWKETSFWFRNVDFLDSCGFFVEMITIYQFGIGGQEFGSSIQRPTQASQPHDDVFTLFHREERSGGKHHTT